MHIKFYPEGGFLNFKESIIILEKGFPKMEEYILVLEGSFIKADL